MTETIRTPMVVIVRDGWGRNPNEAHDSFNAVKLANTPRCDALLDRYPHTLIHTAGEDVGLPEGTMGNSEVGHQNLGAGRVVDQESVRITKAIREGASCTSAPSPWTTRTTTPTASPVAIDSDRPARPALHVLPNAPGHSPPEHVARAVPAPVPPENHAMTPTRTIEIEDTLQSRVEFATSATEDVLRQWLDDLPENEQDPDILRAPCLNDDLDRMGEIDEIAKNSTPIRTSEIRATMYLYGDEIERAWDDLGPCSPGAWGGGWELAAIQLYIEQEIARWYKENADEIVADWWKENRPDGNE